MTAPAPLSPAGPERGFILVAVLWILAALATLASVYTIYAVNTASGAHLPEERLRAEMAIRAGVELAAYQVMAAPPNDRPARGAFAAKLGGLSVEVAFLTEGARVDLNAAPHPLLAGLFKSLGYEKAADAYASRIEGWRTEVAPNAPNKEADDYSAAGMPYPPRGGPFASTLELSLVRDLPPDLIERMAPYVTVFSGTAQIDVIDAEPTVLAALPGVPPEVVRKLLAARAKAPVDKAALLAMLGPAQGLGTTGANPSLRARIVVTPPRGRRIQAEVVFRLAQAIDRPFDILSWRDDFDAPF